MSNKDFKVKNGIQPTVYHEAVGTVVSNSEAYSIANASYDGVSFSVSSQEITPLGLAFNTNGTKMYIVGAANDTVYQYSLSTGFDLSTASYDSVSVSVSGFATLPYALKFNPSGTVFYIVDPINTDIISFSLSTAYDISTANHLRNFDVSSQASPLSLTFNGDGTKMYMVSANADAIYQYSLSTAYDLNGASYDSVSFSLLAQDENPSDVVFNSDGTKMYIVGEESNGVFQYSLSTAYDISTASYDSIFFSVASQETAPRAMAFNADATKMYIIGPDTDTIYQYSTVLTTAELDLSTGSVFDYTPTSDVQVTLTNPAASGTSSGATLLLGSEDSAGVSSTFSTTLYEGTQATNSIDNGLDLATDGGLVWIKRRDSGSSHSLWDSGRGISNWLSSDNNSGQIDYTTTAMVSFNTDGFTLGVDTVVNASAASMVSWTFKKQTKFFDIVTYTGDGVAGREIAHNLGSTPAVIITKNLNDVENWQVYHKDLGNDQRILLNQDIASGSAPTHWNSTTPTSTVFTVGTHNGTNGSGDGIVAYLFAHDTDASSIIKCGSYTGTGSAGNAVTLGWEPQFIIIKGSTGGRNWIMFDSARGMTTGNDPYLMPNKSNGEGTTTDWLDATATGFELQAEDPVNASGETFIYIAIRSPSIPTIAYDPDLQWSGGTAPTAPATGETDVITFNTTDGGTTYKSALAIDGAK